MTTKNWLASFQNNKPFIIAGPCSAETEEQVVTLAHQLKNSSVSVFRAGIWKPRTRPGGFEGVGEIGLQWLQRAKKETGMRMAVEVANATHVALALAHDIDVLWIGARTTANPFLVQEIADSLANTDKIVLLKNPINPDLSLWIGGLERLQKASIKKLGVIHRGFSAYEKTKYRNVPEWQIPIDFHNRFPEVVLLNDPSHISGRRDLIQEVSQQALDLNFDGLMIETHCNPDAAWSDAKQQVTPDRLFEIISQLKVRKTTIDEDDYNFELLKLRTQIDEYDRKLLEVLGSRMKISEKIGALKKQYNVAILQNQRWQEILEKMIVDGQSKQLNEEFILTIFKAIHQESIMHQEKIINSR